MLPTGGTMGPPGKVRSDVVRAPMAHEVCEEQFNCSVKCLNQFAIINLQN